MNKNTYETITLATGEIHRYDLGTARLHAYKTNDAMADEVFIVEKNGHAVVIESPCFTANIAELNAYLADMVVDGVLIAYHGAGASFLPDAPKYATENAIQFSQAGGGKALIDRFASVFGSAFDAGIHPITHVLSAGETVIGGIRMNIVPTADAFDVEFPELGILYTHMLGHDCHSIVAGAAHASAMIAELKTYIQKGYALLLTSHYTPEDLKDAQTKIDYLEELKRIASNCSSAEAFKAEVAKRYPAYSGQNYLDMTAGFFYEG